MCDKIYDIANCAEVPHPFVVVRDKRVPCPKSLEASSVPWRSDFRFKIKDLHLLFRRSLPPLPKTLHIKIEIGSWSSSCLDSELLLWFVIFFELQLLELFIIMTATFPSPRIKLRDHGMDSLCWSSISSESPAPNSQFLIPKVDNKRKNSSSSSSRSRRKEEGKSQSENNNSAPSLQINICKRDKCDIVPQTKRLLGGQWSFCT